MQTDAFVIEEDKARRYATLRLSRGADGNRLLAQEIPLVGKAIRSLAARKDVKLVLVRGDGENFCLGRKPDAPGSAPTTALGIRSGITALSQTFPSSTRRTAWKRFSLACSLVM